MSGFENSGKGRRMIRLLMAPVMVVFLASMARAQDDTSRFAAGADGLQTNENQHRLVSSIEGSWLFNIEITDLNNQKIALNSLVSFIRGGVVITSASVWPSPTFYGSWRQTGPYRFNVVFYGFEPDPVTGVLVIRKQHLRVDLTGRNHLTAVAIGYTCDLQGENCTEANTGLSSGKRILVK